MQDEINGIKVEDLDGRSSSIEVVGGAESDFYVALIMYSGGVWSAGPSSVDRQSVLDQLKNWDGAVAFRLYRLKVPADINSKMKEI